MLSLAFYGAYDPVTPGALPSLSPPSCCATSSASKASLSPMTSAPARSRATRQTAKAARRAALAAGADLLQISSPEDQDGAREAILAAVEAGELSEERLAQAAGRVLELKRSLGLLELP